MLGLILATALATQVHEQDFYFMMAQENFVINSLPKPIRYSQYVPHELRVQFDIWDEECHRCRRNANIAVVNMGTPAIRWLFWALRAKSVSVSMHAEAVINKLISCPKCEGAGQCRGFQPKIPGADQCEICGFYSVTHEYQTGECMHCQGRGIFTAGIRLYDTWGMPR